MVDIAVLVREFLLTQPDVTAALQPGGSPNGNANNAIYAGADLPEHFNPQQGPCIQLVRSGGISPPEIPPMVVSRLMVRVWADQEQYQVMSDVYGAIQGVLAGTCNVEVDEGMMLSALETMGPQEMSDPDTAWVCLYAFYTILARATS
jgi:hypothetical protein